MAEKTKYTLSEHLQQLLDAGRYKDSFTLMRKRLVEAPIPGALNQLSQAESTYRYMLDYFTKGLEDPGRDSMLADIRFSLRNIAQRLEKEAQVSDSPDLYYSTLRMCRLRPTDLQASVAKIIELKANADLALSAGQYPDEVISGLESEEEKIFNTLWTSDQLTEADFRAISESIMNETLPFTTAALAISATGLSLMRFYNRDAMLLLCTLATSTDFRISSRALATLVLALNRWRKTAADDSRLASALSVLLDMEGMSRKIISVVKTVIRTRDTDRVSRKLEREVIPGLMQFGPDIIEKMKKQTEDSSFADLEANPEWEELLRNSGLEEKLRELTEMQSDGADVMMVAFSNLKGYPFFRQVRNWMLPFSVQHPALRKLHSIDDNGLTSLLEMSGMMCDSDKYSFAFSLTSMPETQRKVVLSQMKAHTEQMKENMQEYKLLKAGMEFDDELTRYFRDLYRFHKLFAKRAEFYDPFAETLDFTTVPVVEEVMDSTDDLAAVAEFYFKRGYYADALPLLQSVARASSLTPHVWEKIGFCLEKQPNGNKESIEAYMKAQLFNPESRWLAKRLGICYRREQDYRNAVDYLRMALPEDGSFDRTLSLLITDTLMEAGRWEEALNELYRVDYESPDDPEVLRRMARCAFRSGDMDKCSKLLNSIPTLALAEEDYRMLGHVAFLEKNFEDAARRYRQTVRPNDDKRLWKSQILTDVDIIENLGGSRSDLLLLLESLAYSLE